MELAGGTHGKGNSRGFIKSCWKNRRRVGTAAGLPEAGVVGDAHCPDGSLESRGGLWPHPELCPAPARSCSGLSEGTARSQSCPSRCDTPAGAHAGTAPPGHRRTAREKPRGGRSWSRNFSSLGALAMAVPGSRNRGFSCVPEKSQAQVRKCLDKGPEGPWMPPPGWCSVCPCWHREHWRLLFSQLFSPWMQKNQIPVKSVLAACGRASQ